MSKKSNRAKKVVEETVNVHVDLHNQVDADTNNNKEVSKELVLTEEQDEALSKLDTTSAKIRYLASIGMERGQIAKKLGKLYQHVRNVLTTQLKRPQGTKE